MHLTLRDSQTLATLLPEEIAVCFVVLLNMAFPATWMAGECGGLLDYIGTKFFKAGYIQ